MATEPPLSFSLASVVEQILQQHAGRLDVNLASRKIEENCIYIYSFFSILLSIQFFLCVRGKLIANIVFLSKKMLVSSFNQ